MKKLKIIIITGTRPELIKLSILIRILKEDPEISVVFIHSGQHYDSILFDNFLRDLKIPKPDYNIQTGSLPSSLQIGTMLIKLYKIVKREDPHIILAQGDTNTVFAAALTSFKNNIPFGHVEAGIRSYDLRMPEEINRILTGCCTLLNFAPTKRAVINLLNEGIPPDRIFLVGNPIVDVVKENIKIARSKSKIEKFLGISEKKKFILMTIHRPSNVDNKENLKKIFDSLLALDNIPIIFPIHPRTKKNLIKFGLYQKIETSKNVKVIEPIGYFDMLKLISLSYFVITDSGGIQEESVILKKPCLTLRTNTERPESIEIGSNILIGTDSNKINYYVSKLWNDKKFYKSMIPKINPFGKGNSSKQIIEIIKKKWKEKKLNIPYINFNERIPHIKLVHINNMNVSVKEFEKENNCIVLEVFDKIGNPIFPKSNLKLRNNMIIKVQYI
ncbi:MAG: non-hydrolyzing UDP-N-acetylglucosamine 2-epimerase [Candidatus Helarchaeota archaeon]